MKKVLILLLLLAGILPSVKNNQLTLTGQMAYGQDVGNELPEVSVCGANTVSTSYGNCTETTTTCYNTVNCDTGEVISYGSCNVASTYTCSGDQDDTDETDGGNGSGGGGSGGGSSGGGSGSNPPSQTKDCAGIWGGSAQMNSCGECVGGTTGKENCNPCIPKSFNYGMSVCPVAMSSEYEGYGWCAFLTLATIKCGVPCTYATYYYANYKQSLNINGCNSTVGVSGSHIRGLYNHFGVSVGSGVYDACTFISGISPGGKALLITTSNHVYMLYQISRTNENVKMDDIQVWKYDTSDENGWDNRIPLSNVDFSANAIISK
jgi:hypothetical protein